MAEIKITDLPLMTVEDFTSNDRFLMIDDGDARAMPKTVFDEWLSANVQGEKGEQGVAGRDGLAGANGTNGVNGQDGLSAYELALSTGFVGTLTQWQASLKGVTGSSGTNGTNGWSPLLKVVARGDDSVLQITDWLGGTGNKPNTLGYIGATGVVTNIANASNIRGLKGDTGLQGEDGVQGIAGEDGRELESITFNPDTSVTVAFTDSTTLVSSIPPTRTGWGTYKDTQYTDTSTLNIPVSSEQVLPNNAVTKLEKLPSNVSTFYQAVSQKYLLEDSSGFYNVRVRFKVIPSSTAGTINLSMSKATTDVPFSEDKSLRGDNKIQEMSFNTVIYGDAALSTNGLTIRAKTFDRAVSIYNIEVTIAKLI